MQIDKCVQRTWFCSLKLKMYYVHQILLLKAQDPPNYMHPHLKCNLIIGNGNGGFKRFRNTPMLSPFVILERAQLYHTNFINLEHNSLMDIHLKCFYKSCSIFEVFILKSYKDVGLYSQEKDCLLMCVSNVRALSKYGYKVFFSHVLSLITG